MSIAYNADVNCSHREPVAATCRVLLAGSSSASPPDALSQAIASLGQGQPVLLHRDGESRATFVYSAQTMSVAEMAFLVRHCSGFFYVAMPAARADELEIIAQVSRNQNRRGTAFAVSVDAAAGIGTGISAADRSHTVRRLADPDAVAADFTRPGHIVSLRAVAGGVLERPGHTEAAVELVRMAGHSPVAVIAELCLADEPMWPAAPAPLSEVNQVESLGLDVTGFARSHDIVELRTAELVEYCRRDRRRVRRKASARIPTAAGEFTAIGYLSGADEIEHVAFVHGDLSSADGGFPILVRRESLIDDCFRLAGAAAGGPLLTLLGEITRAGRGVLLYLRSADGTANGLLGQLQRLQAAQLGAEVLPADHTSTDSLDDIVRLVLDDLGVRAAAVVA